MWRFAICLTAGLMILACSDKDEPGTPTAPEPNTGTTRKFTVTYPGYPNCCPDNLRSSRSNADIFCINLGYEYSTTYTQTDWCYCVSVQRSGPWLTSVTCWKP